MGLGIGGVVGGVKLQGVVLAGRDVAPVDGLLADLSVVRVLDNGPQLDADRAVEQGNGAAVARLQLHLVHVGHPREGVLQPQLQQHCQSVLHLEGRAHRNQLPPRSPGKPAKRGMAGVALPPHS